MTAGIDYRTAFEHAPLGLVLSGDETRLFVTCAAPESQVCVVDLAQQRITARHRES